jgi:hypothetical protein
LSYAKQGGASKLEMEKMLMEVELAVTCKSISIVHGDNEIREKKQHLKVL